MLTRWDPFRDLKGVEAEFDRMVGQAYSKNAWVPALDIRETEDRFEVTVDLPGMGSDDVEVTFEDGTLTIRGQREFSREEDEEPVPPDRAQLTARSRGRCGCLAWPTPSASRRRSTTAC